MTTKLHRFRKKLKTFRNEGKENREPGVDGLKAETRKANTRTSNQPHVTLFVYVLWRRASDELSLIEKPLESAKRQDSPLGAFHAK